MIFSATWLLALVLCGPLAGVVLGLALTAGKRSRTVAAVRSVRAGHLIGLLAAIGLACVTRGVFGSASETIVWSWGTWLNIDGPRPLRIDWAWQADSLAAAWLVLLSSLSWLVLSRSENDNGDATQPAFNLTAGMVHVAACAFVLSTNLVQMVFFWSAIAMAALLMAGWSSRRRESSDAIRNVIQTGFLTDGFLLLAVLLMGRQCGGYAINLVFSAEGLARLGHGNPALPEFVGCLLVLGVIGRCGMFPCFGWHRDAPAWSGRTSAMIYGVGYVPSAIWLLLRCQPVLVGSESSLALLGGLGTLGAVLSAFVACGMDEPRRAMAFVLTSHVGVMLAALGSGVNEAAALCVWHQCGVSVAAFVLFACWNGDAVRNQLHRVVLWCAALSLAGVLPLTGGWSHRALLELHTQPVPSISAPSETDRTVASDEVSLASEGSVSPPHWGWLYGLWLAQGLTAFAVVRAVARTVGPNEPQDVGETNSTGLRPKFDGRLLVAGAVLLTGGLFGALLGVPNAVPKSNDIEWLVIGQSAALCGLIAAWQGTRRPTRTAAAMRWWEPIARLSRECLYIDRLVEIVLHVPAWIARSMSEFIELLLTERLCRAVTIRLPAWLGMQLETVQLGGVEFSLATMLLGTAALLLTLFVIT